MWASTDGYLRSTNRGGGFGSQTTENEGKERRREEQTAQQKAVAETTRVASVAWYSGSESSHQTRCYHATRSRAKLTVEVLREGERETGDAGYERVTRRLKQVKQVNEGKEMRTKEIDLWMRGEWGGQ